MARFLVWPIKAAYPGVMEVALSPWVNVAVVAVVTVTSMCRGVVVVKMVMSERLALVDVCMMVCSVSGTVPVHLRMIRDRQSRMVLWRVVRAGLYLQWRMWSKCVLMVAAHTLPLLVRGQVVLDGWKGLFHLKRVATRIWSLDRIGIVPVGACSQEPAPGPHVEWN